MKDISKIIETAQKMIELRHRDKYGKFLPGLKETKIDRQRLKDVKKIEFHEDGCVNLVTAMMFNISNNIKTPQRILSVEYNINTINYLKDLKEWIKIDNLWITSWCEMYDFDEQKVRQALINKVENKLKTYQTLV